MPEPERGQVMFKVEVIADSTGKWIGNGLKFPTREEADAYGVDLASRWTAVVDYRIVEEGKDG